MRWTERHEWCLGKDMEGVEGDMFEESDENYKKKKTPVVWQTF
jgi:hypothetical protein